MRARLTRIICCVELLARDFICAMHAIRAGLNDSRVPWSHQREKFTSEFENEFRRTLTCSGSGGSTITLVRFGYLVTAEAETLRWDAVVISAAL